MYRKIRFGLLAVVLLLCACFDSGAKGQLNFSTGWGKRSQRMGVADGSSVECSGQARPSLEQLLTVYNFIQTEAQKLLDCQRLNK